VRMPTGCAAQGGMGWVAAGSGGLSFLG
jgi:hypothetical protein